MEKRRFAFERPEIEFGRFCLGFKRSVYRLQGGLFELHTVRHSFSPDVELVLRSAYEPRCGRHLDLATRGRTFHDVLSASPNAVQVVVALFIALLKMCGFLEGGSGGD